MLKKHILFLCFILISKVAFTQIFVLRDEDFIKKFESQESELINVWNIDPAAGHNKFLEIKQNASPDKRVYYEALGIYDAYFHYNLKEGIRTIKKLKPIIEQSNDKYLKHFYYLHTAYFYDAIENNDLVKINLEKAFKYASDSSEIKDYQVALSKVYLQLGMPKNCIEIFEKFLIDDLKSNQVRLVQFDYYMLTNAYLLDRNFVKANQCIQNWKKLILDKKKLSNEIIELEFYNYLFEAQCGIEGNKLNLKSEIETNLKKASKGNFADLNFLEIYLKTKQMYFDWVNFSDSSNFYKNKLTLHAKNKTQKYLKAYAELEEEEKLEKQLSKRSILAWVLALVVFLGCSSYLLIINQGKKKSIDIESKEQILDKYSAILKEKYNIINQTEIKLNELQKEIKDADHGKKIKDIKNAIRLSVDELKFFKELSEGEIINFENLRKNLPELTETEIRIVFLIVKDKSINAIADILSISAKAAENHRYRIRKKLKLTQEQSLEGVLKQQLLSKRVK